MLRLTVPGVVPSTTMLGIEIDDVVGEASEPSEAKVKLVPTFCQATVEPVALELV